MRELTFAELRAANVQRLPLFKNNLGQPAHSMPDGSDWSLWDWFKAVHGEAGEYGNESKKFKRGDYEEHEFRERAENEIPDVIIYTDITLFRMNMTFEQAFSTGMGRVVQSFDEIRLQFVNPQSVIPDESECFVRAQYHLAVAGAGAASDDRVKVHNNISRMMCFWDMIAKIYDINLSEAIVNKFNKTSNKIGCDVKL